MPSAQEASGHKRNKKPGSKLNGLLQGEDLSVGWISCKPLPGSFTILQKHHLHTQAVCAARVGIFGSPDYAEMDITRFIRIFYCLS